MAITLNNNLATMKVGEYVWCKYTASRGVVGVFSEFATKTDADVVGQEIPVTSTATPNGYFKFIMVEDWNGKKRLVADRNIQHSISWDNLNTSGVASGSGLPISSLSEEPTVENGYNIKKYTVRILTGGIDANDKDNEWDKYIVDSNLNGTITPDDNSIWNWSEISSWTSTVGGTTPTERSSRGRTSVDAYTSGVTSGVSTRRGFRPLLEEYKNEKFIFNKTLILHEDVYKNYKSVVTGTKEVDLIPFAMTSDSMNGVTLSASAVLSGYPVYQAFDKNDSTQWLTHSPGVLPNPQYLNIKFDIPQKVTRIQLVEYNPGISNFKLQNSDDGISYQDIFSGNMGAFVRGEVKEFNISNSNRKSYWRFELENNTNAHGFASVTLFGEEESLSYRWNEVNNSTPTINQFNEEGMDELPPIFERKITTLVPIKMDLDTEFIGEGKLYRKKIDLNKYFDLRTITTETRNS